MVSIPTSKKSHTQVAPSSRSTSRKTTTSSTSKKSTKNILTIHGFEGCGYFEAAVNAAKIYIKNYPGTSLVTKPVPRSLWENTIQTYAISKNITNHKTSPLIFYNTTYIGGHDALIMQLKKSVPFS